MLTIKDFNKNNVSVMKRKQFFEEKIKVLNQDSIERLLDPSYGGSQHLFMELSSIYLQEMPERMYLLSKAIEENDFEGVEHQAHKIRSGAAYLGVTKIVEIAQKLELMGVSRLPVEDEALFQEMDSVFVKSVDELEQVRSQLLN